MTPRTKRDWLIINATRAILAERFPLAFVPRGNPKLPLALGIHKAIAERAPDIARAHVKLTIAAYVAGPKYWRACVEGAARVDLDGMTVETISADAAKNAARRLADHEAYLERERTRRLAQASVAEAVSA